METEAGHPVRHLLVSHVVQTVDVMLDALLTRAAGLSLARDALADHTTSALVGIAFIALGGGAVQLARHRYRRRDGGQGV